MIEKISNTLFRVDEEVSYYTDMFGIMKKYTSEELQLTKFTQDLEKAVENAIKAIHKTMGSGHTELANELEKFRDNCFRATRDAVKACTLRSNPELASNAKIIERIIRKHGWNLYAEGAKVQTTLMKSLKDELDKEVNQKLIKSIGLIDWYTEMNDANESYLNVINTRFDEAGQREKFDNSAIYNTMREAGDKIYKAIEVLYHMNGNEKYMAIASDLSRLAEEYMVKARSRKTRSGNEKTEINESE